MGKHRETVESFHAYGVDAGKWGWGVIMYLLGVVTLAIALPDLPTWVLFAATVVVLLIAPFVAYHKLRMRYEVVRKQLARMKDLIGLSERLRPLLHEIGDICDKLHNHGEDAVLIVEQAARLQRWVDKLIPALAGTAWESRFRIELSEFESAPINRDAPSVAVLESTASTYRQFVIRAIDFADDAAINSSRPN